MRSVQAPALWFRNRGCPSEGQRLSWGPHRGESRGGVLRPYLPGVSSPFDKRGGVGINFDSV